MSTDLRSDLDGGLRLLVLAMVVALGICSTGEAVTAEQKAAGDASENVAADEVLAELRESAERLKAVFDLDFSKGMPREVIAINGDDSAYVAQADGVRTHHLDGTGMNGLRACLQLHGDFDVTAAFSDLQIAFSGSTGRAGVGLLTCLENLTQDNIAVYRRNDKDSSESQLAFVHRILKSDGKTGYSQKNGIETASAGQLRIARRGNTVYGLFAPADSNEFRLLTSRKVEPGDVGVQGLRLVMQGGDGSETSVTWQKLSVRAERISGLPVRDSKKIIAELDATRDGLVRRFVDFTDSEQVDKTLQLDQTAVRVREHTNDGLRLTLISEQSEQSAKVSMPADAGQEFDVAAAFRIHQLETPDKGNRKSEVVMQVFLETPADITPQTPLEVSFILRADYGGGRTLVARYVGQNRVRKKIYRPIRDFPVTAPAVFRIAFREASIVFLYSEESDDQPTVVAEYPIETPVQMRSVALASNARGQGYITDVTWKSLTLSTRAEGE